MTTIREYDAHNNLVAAGYEWGEPDRLRLILVLAAAALALVLALSGAELIEKNASASGIAVFGLAAVCAWAAFAIYKRRFRTRSLIFRDDGTIDAPHRLPDFTWPRYRVDGHHRDIGNIGQLVDHDPDGKREHRTALYAKNGNIVRVTGDVHPDIAHKVAVQLTAALHEIRETMAWRASAAAMENE